MIVQDTNVVAEPMKSNGNPAVRAWLDRQVAKTQDLTATSLSEFLVGVALPLAGGRTAGLEAALGELVARLFGSRMSPFDRHSAQAYSPLVDRGLASGRPSPVADAQVGAIAAAYELIVATPDTEHVTCAGVTVINAWEAAPDRAPRPS